MIGMLYKVALSVVLMTLLTPGVAVAAPRAGCERIQEGSLFDSAGRPLTLGPDEFGYDYQAHLFNGTYDSSDRVLDGKYFGSTGDYVDDKLIMKWSDTWLANVDCNGDHKLDRGLGTDGHATNTSRGWLTNLVVGDGYTYFAKIVWTGPGSPLWSQYTLVQEVFNDRESGTHGLSVKLGAPGFGLNGQWTE